MKIQEKLKYLEKNYFGEWLDTRRKVADELSEKQSGFCICGRLATGLHERSCRKFQNKITSETVKRLEHLIENK